MHETEKSGELPEETMSDLSARLRSKFWSDKNRGDGKMPVAGFSELCRPSRSAESKPCERPLAVLHPETAGHPG